VATVDIGTNTVLLLVAETTGDGTLVAVEEHATITRLGQGVDKTRTLAADAIARTNACVEAYAEITRRAGAERVAVVGTSAMRDAGGGDVVRTHVKSCFGVDARTISGEEEARLTFAGALSGLDAQRAEGDVVVFDIGGGSTEVVRGEPKTRRTSFAHSYDVGSVRLTERHVKGDPPTDDERAALARAAEGAFASLPELRTETSPIGIAGTMTTLAAVSMRMATYDGARVHGHRMPVTELARVVAELAAVPLAIRKDLPGLEPKRADVIIAGGHIALALLARLGARDVVISDRGVRWGLAEELAAAP